MSFQNQTPLDEQMVVSEPSSLEITDSVRSSWRELSSWSVFAGISSLIVVFALIFAWLRASATYAGVSPMTTILVFINTILILILGILYLRAGFSIRSSLEREEQALAIRGFGALLNVYRVSVIAMIVTVVLYMAAAIIGVFLLYSANN
jgi:hypothetical protein